VGCQWRIRHKLMLGLGLVVGIMALQLGGTLYGMISFRDAMQTFDKKFLELKAAQDFKETVTALDRRPQGGPVGNRTEQAFPSASEVVADLSRLREDCRHAQEALNDYQARLNDTVTHGRDPDRGFYKGQLIEALRQGFGKLDEAARAASQLEFKPNRSSQELLDERMPSVHAEIRTLLANSNDLEMAIFQDLYHVMEGAKIDLTRSMVIAIVMCVLGVVLLAGLHRLAYRWVEHPIRDLQQGVHRVAQGDFAQQIEVHSGDEMEELAAAFNDMTGRLHDMYADLARQVNERSRQLVRSERLASVGFLAAGVAHEINNPLASIAFCSEALEGRLQALLHSPGVNGADPGPPGEGEEVVTKYLRMIQQEAFRCKKITERLLEFSRGGERRREPTDLVELVQAVLDVVQHLQNGKGKEVVLHTPSRLVARVNAQEIKSVVLNLVVNALDSMDDGGTLTISLAQRDDQAELSFADTGCGMTPEVLENIFEPFFTRSRTGKGTGLGLSISHRVISQHGGEIEAVSPGVNQGSTFTVRLPLQPPAESVKEESLGHAAA
jgi:signal transduction histidine kinase